MSSSGSDGCGCRCGCATVTPTAATATATAAAAAANGYGCGRGRGGSDSYSCGVVADAEQAQCVGCRVAQRGLRGAAHQCGNPFRAGPAPPRDRKSGVQG